MSLVPGVRLGAYEILAPIGAGGMGEVYRARDPRLGREVAVKVLRAIGPPSPGGLHRFEQEARATAALNHPNIVAVYDVGVDSDAPFVVSELLEGETLRARLLRGPVPVRKATDYGRQIAEGLAAAHAKGIVHRDLKPENLFLTGDGRVKILDFGLAKLLEPDADADRSVAMTIPLDSESGRAIGSVGYMAPEQVRGQPADARSDVFGLGAVLYEMLTGRQPFRRETAADTLAAILHEEPPDIADPDAKIPPTLLRIVRRCLEKVPAARFQSASDLAFALAEIPDRTAAAPATATTSVAPRRWRIAFGIIVPGLVWAAWLVGARSATRATGSAPTFRALTFRQGHVTHARFAPDGQTIVYSAAWDGKPYELFATRRDIAESRTLGLPPASILAISSGGEMAISSGCHWFQMAEQCDGTLARVPIAGGAPREILDHAGEADWSPDGARLAVIVHDDLGDRLESPIGTVLHRSVAYGGLSSPRFSSSGDMIAFIDSTPAGEVSIMIVDPGGGPARRVANVPGVIGRLAWSPTGHEIWFFGRDPSDGPEGGSIRGVALSGRIREVWRTDGDLTVHDIDHDGRVLLSRNRSRDANAGMLAGDTAERDLSGFLSSIVADLSADGTTLLFGDQPYGGGGLSARAMYLRRNDSMPPVRLANGLALNLSPDKKWAIGISNDAPGTSNEWRLLMTPTGAGEPLVLPKGPIELYNWWVRWLPDHKRIVFSAKERGHGWRCYVQDLSTGPPQPITPEVPRMIVGRILMSPDGRSLTCGDPTHGGIALYPIDGGSPRSIPGVAPDDDPIQWSNDGRFLYVWHFDYSPQDAANTSRIPGRVYRIDLTTGHRVLWKEIQPSDPAGVIYMYRVLMTPDASAYAYSYTRVLSDLYLVEGLK